MGSLSIWHWIIVIAVVLLVFGRGKISELMTDVAQGIKAFKKGMQDDEPPAEPASAEPVKTIDHQPQPVTTAAPTTAPAAQPVAAATAAPAPPPAPAAAPAPASRVEPERRFEGGTV